MENLPRSDAEIDELRDSTVTSRLIARAIRYQLAHRPAENTSHQEQSILFHLPAELRNLVYICVFKHSQTQSTCRYCGIAYHDGMQGNGGRDPLIDIALLRTCRIVYHEASDLPLRLTILHSCSGSLNCLRHRISKLTAMNILNLNKVKVHAHDLYDMLSQLRDLSRLAQFQPSGLLLHAVAQDPSSWHMVLQCGLNRGIVPSSVQIMRLELKFRNTDFASWTTDTEPLEPLRLVDRNGDCFVQRPTSCQSMHDVATSTGLTKVITKVIMLFVRSPRPAVDGFPPGQLGALRLPIGKVPAHLNYIRRNC